MQILIREAKMSDLQALYQLNCKEMGYELPYKDSEKQLQKVIASEKDKVFVATVNDEVVGYVHANDYDLLYMSHMKNIMGIAVDTQFKHNGIGKKLMDRVETWAKETDASGIRLVSGSTRLGAHEFYRHCGFSGGKQQLNFKKMF